MKKFYFTPYILPVISLVAIILFLKPNLLGGITGFAIQSMDAEIKISASEIIPENSLIVVTINNLNQTTNQTANLTIGEFVKLAGKKERSYGRLPAIGYEGYGYLGTYSLPLSSLDLDLNLEKGKYNLTIKIIYDNTIISEVSEIIFVE
jgi:hypothetical protein